MRHAASLLALVLVATAAGAELPQVASVAVEGPVAVRPGESVTVKVAVTIKPGYHVQANPVLNEALIPILLTVPDTPSVRAGPPVYPPPEHLRLLGSEEDLVVYGNTFVIRQPLSVRMESPPGEAVLGGTLRYQACDDRHCLRPRTLPIEVRLLVRD